MTEIFGILNVTPDSFSDGGKFDTVAAAVRHAEHMLAAGATIIDIGGESTRPGSTRVTPAEEQRRILQVVREVSQLGAVVSVDTLHASTAELALAAGAQIINDVSGGLHDPAMYQIVAAAGAKYVLGHWRGIPDPQHRRSNYDNVTAEVAAQLNRLANAAQAAGVAPEKIIVDPGLGFDKTAAQCWQLLHELGQLQQLGYPVLIGLSRKRMIAAALQEVAVDAAAALATKDLASAVANVLAVQQGAWAVRTHDVAATTQALAVWHNFTAAVPRTVQPQTGARTVQPQTGAPTVQPQTAVTTAAATVTAAVPNDTIFLSGLEVYAHHGVFAAEKTTGQTFLIDAVLELDFAAGNAADEITRTVNYGEVAAALHAAAAADPVDLLETLAERLAKVCLSFTGVAAVTVTVHKPEAPITVPFGDVGITITRRRPAATTTATAKELR